MARVQTIVTAITCDFCGGEGTETFTILIDVGVRQLSKPRVVDACDPCADPIRTLQLDVRRVGVLMRDDAQVERERDLIPCPVCAHGMGRNNIYTHLRKVHHVPVPKQPKTCPDCGTAANNMPRHRTAAHGYSLVDAYAEVASSMGMGR